VFNRFRRCHRVRHRMRGCGLSTSEGSQVHRQNLVEPSTVSTSEP